MEDRRDLGQKVPNAQALAKASRRNGPGWQEYRVRVSETVPMIVCGKLKGCVCALFSSSTSLTCTCTCLPRMPIWVSQGPDCRRKDLRRTGPGLEASHRDRRQGRTHKHLIILLLQPCPHTASTALRTFIRHWCASHTARWWQRCLRTSRISSRTTTVGSNRKVPRVT